MFSMVFTTKEPRPSNANYYYTRQGEMKRSQDKPETEFGTCAPGTKTTIFKMSKNPIYLGTPSFVKKEAFFNLCQKDKKIYQ
jgi:hypothetical protein